MKFRMYNTKGTFNGDIGIDSLETLCEFVNMFNNEIIIGKYNNPLDKEKEVKYFLEVYDDYRE